MTDIQERVDALDQYEFDLCADGCATTLRLFGQGFAMLSPGDATMYRISIVRPLDVAEWRRHEYLMTTRPEQGPHPWPGTHAYYVATNFGPMYPWHAEQHDTSYVLAKWTFGGRPDTTDHWTAAVICRFLNTLARKLADG